MLMSIVCTLICALQVRTSCPTLFAFPVYVSVPVPVLLFQYTVHIHTIVCERVAAVAPVGDFL